MKESKLKKIRLLSASLVLFLSCHIYFTATDSISTNFGNLEIMNFVAEEIGTMSAPIKWIYKTVDGKTYKRLYNYSTNEWIGDWILVS